MPASSMLISRLCAAGLLTVFAAAPAVAQPTQLESGAYRLEVTLEREEGADWKAVEPGRVFESGDRVRFLVKTNFDGYLYVTNHGTSGRYSTLFPTEETGSANRIEAGKIYRVPNTEGAFRLAGPAGHEVVYWMMSPTELGAPPAYKPLPPAPRKPAPPSEMFPRCDETILRARGDCIDSSAGPQPLADTNQDGEAMRSRQLVFVQNAGSSVVSAPEQLTGPVIFEYRIAHR